VALAHGRNAAMTQGQSCITSHEFWQITTPHKCQRPAPAPQAALAGGWDVISPDDQRFSDALWHRLAHRPGNGAAPAAGQRVRLRHGEALQTLDRPVRQFYALLEARAPARPCRSPLFCYCRRLLLFLSSLGCRVLAAA